MKIITTILGFIAAGMVWWVIATDPWVSENFIRITIVLLMIAAAFLVGYAIGATRGERTGRAEGYDIGFREGEWRMRRRK